MTTETMIRTMIDDGLDVELTAGLTDGYHAAAYPTGKASGDPGTHWAHSTYIGGAVEKLFDRVYPGRRLDLPAEEKK